MKINILYFCATFLFTTLVDASTTTDPFDIEENNIVTPAETDKVAIIPNFANSKHNQITKTFFARLSRLTKNSKNFFEFEKIKAAVIKAVELNNYIIANKNGLPTELRNRFNTEINRLMTGLESFNNIAKLDVSPDNENLSQHSYVLEKLLNLDNFEKIEAEIKAIKIVKTSEPIKQKSLWDKVKSAATDLLIKAGLATREPDTELEQLKKKNAALKKELAKTKAAKAKLQQERDSKMKRVKAKPVDASVDRFSPRSEGSNSPLIIEERNAKIHLE